MLQTSLRIVVSGSEGVNRACKSMLAQLGALMPMPLLS